MHTPHQQAEALQRLAAGDTQRTIAALLGVDQDRYHDYTEGSVADLSSPIGRSGRKSFVKVEASCRS